MVSVRRSLNAKTEAGSSNEEVKKAMNAREYFQTSIVPCQECARDPVIAESLTPQKLEPFGADDERYVLLLGHSPKVRTSSEIDTTLDLNYDRQLKRYIVNEVLTPLGIDLSVCYATNAVKCLTKTMPEEIASDPPFMERAFSHCKRHLIHELAVVRPRLLISVSQSVSNLLQILFWPSRNVRPMKDIFATLLSIEANGEAISWIPVVHVPKAKVLRHYFPEQTTRLAALSGDVQRLLSEADHRRDGE